MFRGRWWWWWWCVVACWRHVDLRLGEDAFEREFTSSAQLLYVSSAALPPDFPNSRTESCKCHFSPASTNTRPLMISGIVSIDNSRSWGSTHETHRHCLYSSIVQTHGPNKPSSDPRARSIHHHCHTSSLHHRPQYGSPQKHLNNE